MSVYRSDDSITDENLVHTDLPDEFNQAPEEMSPANEDRLLLESAGNNGYKRFLRLSTLRTWITTGLTVAWGNLTGNLSDQTDLKNALDQKVENITNADAGFELVKPKVGVNVPIKTILAGQGISITDNGSQLTFQATGGVWGGITGTLSDQSDLQAELDSKAPQVHSHTISQVTGLQGSLNSKIETVSNVGPGAKLVNTKNGTDVPVKTLVAGPNVTISEQADTVTIAATGGGGGSSIPHQITGTNPVNIITGDTAIESFAAQQIFGGLRLKMQLRGAQYATNLLAEGVVIEDQNGTTTYARLDNIGLQIGAGTPQEILLNNGTVKVGQSGSRVEVMNDRIYGITQVDAATAAASKQYVDNGMAGKANISHTHVIGDVTGLQGALDGKLSNVISGGASGTSLAMAKQGTNGRIKSLVAGANVTLTDNGDSVTIAAAGGGGGGALQWGKVEITATTLNGGWNWRTLNLGALQSAGNISKSGNNIVLGDVGVYLVTMTVSLRMAAGTTDGRGNISIDHAGTTDDAVVRFDNTNQAFSGESATHILMTNAPGETVRFTVACAQTQEVETSVRSWVTIVKIA